VDNLIAGWRAEGMKRAGGDSGRRVAVALLVAAKRSIGRANVALELKRSLGRLLERYEALEQQIAAVQQEVEEVLTEVSACAKLPLETLKLSPWLSAVILANTGELSGYADGRQIMALAGLSLCESSSGKRRGQVVLSKRGRSQLRKYLYLTVVGLVQNHSAFKRWHKHNVKTLRMRKGRSILKLVGKLSRLLVGIAHSGETFDERRHPLQPISA
jgi:transposase